MAFETTVLCNFHVLSFHWIGMCSMLSLARQRPVM